MATNNNAGAPTIAEFIEAYIVEPLTIDSFFLKMVITGDKGNKFVISGDNIVVKYMDELKPTFHTVTMSDAEFIKYRYRPKILSYDTYGTTELWWLILMANELNSSTQFNMQTIQMPDMTIKDKLERILTLNNDIILANDDEVRDTLQGKQ